MERMKILKKNSKHNERIPNFSWKYRLKKKEKKCEIRLRKFYMKLFKNLFENNPKKRMDFIKKLIRFFRKIYKINLWKIMIKKKNEPILCEIFGLFLCDLICTPTLRTSTFPLWSTVKSTTIYTKLQFTDKNFLTIKFSFFLSSCKQYI